MPPLPGAPGVLGAAADGEDETLKSLCRTIIRAQKPYDTTREPNYDAWMVRVVFHMSVSKIDDDKRISSLLLLFDTNSFGDARHLGIQDNTDFETAKQKLKAYFAITETPEKRNQTFVVCRQEAGEMIESVARNIKLIGHRAYTGNDF